MRKIFGNWKPTFILSALALTVLGLCAGIERAQADEKSAPRTTKTVSVQAREYLGRILYGKGEVDRWLSRKVVLFGEVYDPLLGWVLTEQTYKEGIDGAVSATHYAETGERRMMAYAGEPCRINTYGDNFTHCSQVNDGETWQEYLAVHLMEPIRNYGVGGYSVYQAYLRMTREEQIQPADYIIFNIFDDDHYRNLHGWRTISLGYTPKTRAGASAPSMPYVEVNPATGKFVEHGNPCPTPESVYNLCDLVWVDERFGNSLIVKLMVARDNIKHGRPERSYREIEALAKEHGLEMQVDSEASLTEAVETVHTNTTLFATMGILDKVEQFAKENGKKILYVLSFRPSVIKKAIVSGERYDQPILDYLKRTGRPYVDLLEAHVVEYAQFKIDVDAYLDRYYIGHYNPKGNLFTALAIKDKLAEMLEPRPLTYTLDESLFTRPETLFSPGSESDK